MKPIKLSTKTKTLVQGLDENNKLRSIIQGWLTQDEDPDISWANVIRVLSMNAPDNEIASLLDPNRFLCESVRLALLQDLYRSYNKIAVPTEEPATWWGFIGLGCIAMAGTIASICEGFDSFASILNLFIGIPYWSIFIIGFTMAIIPVIFFYGFDFDEISKNLNLPLYQSKKTLDIFLEQSKLIESLRKKIKHTLQEILENTQAPPGAHKNEEHEQLLRLYQMLLICECQLQQVRPIYTSEYQRVHEQYYLKIAKALMVILAGLLYFACGFFAGQTLAMALLSAFLSASLTTTTWPVLLVSISIGIASLSIYCFAERLNVENLVERWLNVDIDKIQELPDQPQTKKHEKKFVTLANSIQPGFFKSPFNKEDKSSDQHQPASDKVVNTA